MRAVIGFLLFVFLVLRPLRANLLASVALQYPLEPKARAQLLEAAHQIDPCSTAILDKLGDAWLTQRNFTMAAIAYGNAMTCSPGNAMARFKFGEMIVAMGFPDHALTVKDASILEPFNPYFQLEAHRLKLSQ